MEFAQIFEKIASKRILIINGEIGLQDQNLINLGIKLCNVQSEINPIFLHIGSRGGDSNCAGYIVDAIKFSKAPVHGIVTGEACSSAFRILLACDRRLSYPHARFMFHGTRIGIQVNDPYFEECVGIAKEGTEKFLRKLAKLSGKPLSQIRRWAKDEKMFTAPEALELNFIEEILKPSKKNL